jgi:hypothetical protein
MPIAMLMEMPGGTADEYDRVMAEMKLDGPPDGAIAHVVVASDDMLRILDVWESREAHDAFLENHLRPAFEAAGVEPKGGEPKFAEVHNVMTVEHMPAAAG